MIVKVISYFDIEKQEHAEPIETELLVGKLTESLESHLSGDTFKLGGSTWSGSRIQAIHLTREEALNKLRTKK
jgi:hypothetical protein